MGKLRDRVVRFASGSACLSSSLDAVPSVVQIVKNIAIKSVICYTAIYTIWNGRRFSFVTQYVSSYRTALVCKYLDSGTISVLLSLHFDLNLDLKRNNEYKVKVQTVAFNLRVFTSILGDQFCTWSLRFWGPKVSGQLASQLFLISQVSSIASLVQL